PVPPPVQAPATSLSARLSRASEPAPAAPPAPADEKLFAPEGSAEGCASGECLPEQAAPPPPSAAAPTASQWRPAVDRIRATVPRQGTALAFGRLLWIRAGEVAVAYPKDAGFHKM